MSTCIRYKISNRLKVDNAAFCKPSDINPITGNPIYRDSFGKTVYRNADRIFDRNNESDIDITDNADMVFNLYARKQSTYFVNKVYPVIPVSSLRHDLMDRARRMTRVNNEHHPWVDMTDEEMLRSCGLILEDPETNKEGITLAAILLFGTDNRIMSVLPQHKTDAIFRVFNVDRYDDMDVVITNLIESYDYLIEFGKKHLNDVFTLDGIQRVSARDKILREIISNLLIHRDFSGGYVPKLVIERDKIIIENASLTHGHGNLNLKTLRPFAKNPPIAKVFREIGLADELGSGMRNSYKYTKLYSGGEPIFTEADVFTTVIPLSEAATATVGPTTQGTTQAELSEKDRALVNILLKHPDYTQTKLADELGWDINTVKYYMNKLKKNAVIQRHGTSQNGHWKVLYKG